MLVSANARAGLGEFPTIVIAPLLDRTSAPEYSARYVGLSVAGRLTPCC